MKKLILILCFCPLLIFGQEGNTSQGVELPDFVITGIQNVSVPIMQKKMPDLKSTLSEDFFEPSFSPEDFNLGDFSNPIKQKAGLNINNDSYDGQLKLGAGRFSLPVGSLSYNKNLQNFLFISKVWGSNIKEYIDNAGYNNSGVLLNTHFFVSNKSAFLPGSVFLIGGKYFRDAYKFYGSVNPDFKRETHNGSAGISFLNNSGNIFNYGLDFKGNIFLLKENDFQENLFNSSGFIKADFLNIGFEAAGYYKRQMLSNNISSIGNYNFFTAVVNAKLKLKETLFVKGGIIYSTQGGNSFLFPTGAVTLKFNDFISLFGEFSPFAEFKTTADFIRENKYYNLGNTDNVFVRNTINLKAALKYQYYKYFEVAGGFRFVKTNNFTYYEDISQQGYFDLQTVDGVNQYSVFMDFLFHPGPYGNFYGNIEFRSVKNSDGKKIPYNAPVTANLFYGYNFNFGFGIQTGLEFASSSYSDINNLSKVPDYYNWTINTKYELFPDFYLTLALENLLNRNNQLYLGYKEKPFDIIGGINYSW